MPRISDARYELEQVAAEPDIVTPIGMAFDRRGRLLVIESHTHQRPAEYLGPAGDRIRMFADSDGDDRLDRWTTFAEGFRHALNVLVRPDGAIYLVTRHNLVLLRDTDDDGHADHEAELVRLQTENEYPHNGLSGIVQLATSDLLIGQGENHGMPYQLIGVDGTTLSGQGGDGGVFRCTHDGRKLQRVATGFWNPFGLCALPDGRIFAVDNDPDASPPCRLLHVVEGADFGFRYQYGRAGNHPLQAWNGELPGTRPMVCGTGEAPTAIVAHAGSLWVTSWGDHRIERYRLVPRGGSYTAEREIVVQGNADFRPTGMAVAPDGSLYFGDWRRRDYEVHGSGRIWRLVLPADEIDASFPPPAADDPPSPPDKLQALRWQGTSDAEAILRESLRSDSADERLLAVRWIADERMMARRDDVAALLDRPLPSPRYYLAVLAAVDWLDHEPHLRNSGINDSLLVRELRNKRRPPAVHALALRLLSPDDKFLTLDRLRGYLTTGNESLRIEAVRSLSQQSNPARVALLTEVAHDDRQSDLVRAEAIAGLAAFTNQQPVRSALRSFVDREIPELSREAARALRLSGIDSPPGETKPPAADVAAWSKLLGSAGDVEAGRRLFFSPVGARCAVCHQHGGRGGRIGPDLTHVGRDGTHERIISSILQPSLEMAPHYQPWVLTTDDGKTHVGLRLHKPGDDGVEQYADSAGQTFILKSESIVDRAASTTSIMPDALETLVSIADLRDLVRFLAAHHDED